MSTQGEVRQGNPAVHWWPSATDIHRVGAWAPCGAGESPLLGTNIPLQVTCGACRRTRMWREVADVTVTHRGSCSLAYGAAACDCGAVDLARSVPVTWSDARLRAHRLLRRTLYPTSHAPMEARYRNPDLRRRETPRTLAEEWRHRAESYRACGREYTAQTLEAVARELEARLGGRLDA